MCTVSRPVVFVVFGLLCLASHARATPSQGVPPDGFGELESTEDGIPCLPSEEYDRLAALSSGRPRALAPGITTETDSLYIWPMQSALHDGVILVNYVDLDLLGPGVRDYMGSNHAYDGHRGTDMTLLSFRSMDRGVPVLAAADGRVLATVDGNFDRRTAAGPYAANYVYIDHGNGNRALYFHLRKNSITVLPGEFVRRGQMIGLTGSSGSSTDAHLHFEPIQRDPWSGPYNPVPSLWSSQEPYVGASPLRVYDMGVFTSASVGGNINFTPGRLKERLSEPARFGTGEPWLGVWLQFQSRFSDGYRLEVRRPDQSLFSSVGAGIFSKFRYGWHYWYWPLPANGPQPGTWTATVTTVAGTSTSHEFQMGEGTAFAPRFQQAGRSFLLGPAVIQDALNVSSLGTPVTYSLHHAPDFVSLQGATVTIDPPSVHRHRSRYFQALATDGFGRQDTMWYHLVDFEAPNRREVPARVFVRDQHRTLPIAFAPSSVCLQVEPVDGSFAGQDVDLSAVFMTSWDTGSRSEIGSTPPKLAAHGDTDRNGVAEVPVCFSREDLAELFRKIRGRKVVSVEVEGDLSTGDRFRGVAELTVLGTGDTGETLDASVFPNPLNPGGHIRFSAPAAGPVTVRIYDLGGRLVRTLMHRVSVPAGAHSVRIDGRGDAGGSLASGVYFYRVETSDRAASGRFVVVK